MYLVDDVNFVLSFLGWDPYLIGKLSDVVYGVI